MAWLVSFFLPHIVIETSSALVNLHNTIGIVLLITGFIAFFISAGQIYYYKLTRKGTVTIGIYKFIRHPQYTSFALCSFGLLLLWPRYLVLVMFITLLCAYYLLAKAEEKECEEKFGQSYNDYKNKTNMFLPFRIPLVRKIFVLPQSKVGKVLSFFAIYIITVLISLGLARGLQSIALDSLYAIYTKDSAYISVNKIEKEKIEELAIIALANDELRFRLDSVKENSNTKYINYIVPAEWYISEIPMNITSGNPEHYFQSSISNKNLYKIIFTKAVLHNKHGLPSWELLLNTLMVIPIVEVWIDVSQKKIIKLLDPPQEVRYENVPVPFF